MLSASPPFDLSFGTAGVEPAPSGRPRTLPIELRPELERQDSNLHIRYHMHIAFPFKLRSEEDSRYV